MGIDEALQERLVAELEQARRAGHLGPVDPVAQVEHSTALARCVGCPPPRFLDLGSGAGVPGLVLAVLWPETSGVLLESSVRRSRALEQSLDRLGLGGRIVVVTDRAEARGHIKGFREAFPVVVARAFGAPAATAECGSAFVAIGGRLIVSEPPLGSGASRPNERWPTMGLGRLGLELEDVWREGSAGFAVLVKTTGIEGQYPRRVGIPARHTLWR